MRASERVRPGRHGCYLHCRLPGAIKALDNHDTRCTTLKLAREALNSLGSTYQLEIHWVKAHVNNKGNEIADRAAKTGCTLKNKIETKYSRACVKQIVNDQLYKEWNVRWQTLPTCRQTFLFYKCIDRAKSKEIYSMSKND